MTKRLFKIMYLRLLGNMPISKIKDIVYYSAIIAILILGTFVYISSHSFPNSIKMFTVQSGSMAPSIPTGSFIVTKPSPVYSQGDIITYRPITDSDQSSGQTITHRIFKIHNRQNYQLYVTKGDSNLVVDSQPVTQEQIVGKVVLSLPFLGAIIDFIKTKQGTSLIIVPGTLIVYREIQKIRQLLRQSD